MSAGGGPDVVLLPDQHHEGRKSLKDLHYDSLMRSVAHIIPLNDHQHLYLAPAWKSKEDGSKMPVFWGWVLAPGVPDFVQSMRKDVRMALVFDLDQTLVSADSADTLKARIRGCQSRHQELTGRFHHSTDARERNRILMELQALKEEEKIVINAAQILHQFTKNNSVHVCGKEYTPRLEPAVLENGTKIQRPVVWLQEDLLLTRLDPDDCGSSMLMRIRPHWSKLRQFLAGEIDASGNKRPEPYKERFYLCIATAGSNAYALEAARILGILGRFIPIDQSLKRIASGVRGSHKKTILHSLGLLNMREANHPRAITALTKLLAVAVDDRRDVWDEFSQAHVFQVLPWSPYPYEKAIFERDYFPGAPQAAGTNDRELLRVMRAINNLRFQTFQNVKGLAASVFRAAVRGGISQSELEQFPKPTSVPALLQDPEWIDTHGLVRSTSTGAGTAVPVPSFKPVDLRKAAQLPQHQILQSSALRELEDTEITLRVSAEPLPILHDDGRPRWQNQVQPHRQLSVPCPPEMVRRIIGKEGQTIKSLKARSGAHIFVKEKDTSSKEVIISGASDCTNLAEEMVSQIIEHAKNRGCQLSQPLPERGLIVHSRPEMVRHVIGPGGQTIKGLEAKSGARIIRKDSSGEEFITSGASDCVDQAKEMITHIIAYGEKKGLRQVIQGLLHLDPEQTMDGMPPIFMPPIILPNSGATAAAAVASGANAAPAAPAAAGPSTSAPSMLKGPGAEKHGRQASKEIEDGGMKEQEDVAQRKRARQIEDGGMKEQEDVAQRKRARQAGKTIVHAASEDGDLPGTEDQVKMDADMNAKDEHGVTALHGASDEGDLRKVQELISLGADVNAKDEAGIPPLHYACLGGHLRVIKMLLEKGADINAKEEKNGATPLYSASLFGQDEAVALLLENSAYAHEATKTGAKPLCAALFRGHHKVVRVLKCADRNKPPQASPLSASPRKKRPSVRRPRAPAKDGCKRCCDFDSESPMPH